MKRILSFTNHKKWLIVLWIIDTAWYVLQNIGLNTINEAIIDGMTMTNNVSSMLSWTVYGYPFFKLFVILYSLLFIVGGFVGSEELAPKKMMRIGIVLACYIIQMLLFMLVNALLTN